MALAMDEGDSHPKFRKIPVIDLRFLSQDEINCAAQWSDEDTELQLKDIVIPKIDRSIFNESAGSRKQTYSRLRFSQRKEELGGLSRRRAGLLSVSRHSVEVGISPTIRRKPANGSDVKDNNQILELLKGLFMKGDRSLACKNAAADEIKKEEAPILQLSNPPNSESGSDPSSNDTHNIQSCNGKQDSGPELGDYMQLVIRNPEMETEGLSAVIQGTHNEQFNGNAEREISDARISDTLTESKNIKIPDTQTEFKDARILDTQMESKDSRILDTQIESKTTLDVERNRAVADDSIHRSRAVADDSIHRPKKRMRTKEDARRKAFANAEEQIAMKASTSIKDSATVDDRNHNDTKTVGSTDDKTFSETGHTDTMVARSTQDNIVNNSLTDTKVADVNHGLPHNDADVGAKGCSLVAQGPFVVQLKRKFAPLETEVELQDFFDKVGGQWASKRKRRKIVDAEDFGDGFPKGWKLLLGVRKKDSRFLIECRKYISPEGQQFASCREVSAYMLSTSMHCPAVELAQEPSSNSTSPVDNSGECFKHQTTHLNDIALLNNEQQQTSSTMTVGKVEDNSRKDNCVIALDTSNFSNRSNFVAHLNDQHTQKVKKTSTSKSIVDGVIIRNGKYECQICHKVFNERNRYAGHVGVHVRNAKRLHDPPGEISSAGKVDIHPSETFGNKFIDDTNVDSTMATSDTKPCDEQEQNGNMDLGKDDANVDSTMETSVTKPCDQQEQNGNTASETMLDSSSPSEENDFTSSHDEGILSTLDISAKDEIDFNSETQKLDNLNGFEEFQMEYTHSPKFAFQTDQDTNSVIDAQIDLGLDAGVLQQEIDPPGQFEWESVLSKIENTQVFSCVWCNSEFSQDGLAEELQSDSVGFICSHCKQE